MEDKLKEVLSVILGINQDQINENTSSDSLEGWDSLKQMNIIVSVEEEFDIQIDEEESILSDSYQSLLKLISKKVNE